MTYIKADERLYQSTVSLMAEKARNKTPRSSFEARGQRLMDYAAIYYFKLRRPLSRISKGDVVGVQRKYNKRNTFEAELMNFTGNLLIAYIEGKSPSLFDGCTMTCVCGGVYSLNYKLWEYNCSHCMLKGVADANGLPVSIPASKEVRRKRAEIHRRISSILEISSTLKFDHVYRMASHIMGVPLPYTHLGFMTTIEEITAFESAVDSIFQLVADKRNDNSLFLEA